MTSIAPVVTLSEQHGVKIYDAALDGLAGELIDETTVYLPVCDRVHRGAAVAVRARYGPHHRAAHLRLVWAGTTPA